MAYYFNDELIKKAREFIPESRIHNRNHSLGSGIAVEILDNLDFGSVEEKDGFLIVCSDKENYAHTYYDAASCLAIEKEIEDEIKAVFDRKAVVDFHFTSSKEVEPDPIPPLYWGGTETIFYYSLSIKIEL